MGFAITLLYLVLSYTRPFELYPQLAPLRMMLVVGVIGIVVSLISWPMGHPRARLAAPQNYLMVAFLGAIVVSQLARAWFGGALMAVHEFGITATMFFLVVMNVTTLKRLRIVAALLVVLSLFLVAQGVLAYYWGYNAELFIGTERGAADPSGDPELREIRMRIISLGVLSDPNDLAQALLSVIPFALLALRPGSIIWNALIVGLPVGVLVFGMYLTKSRGGFLGLLLLALLLLRSRLKGIYAMALTGILGVGALALGFTGGRAITVQEGSAGGRLEAWSAGLQMLKSHPAFGVGYGAFTDYHERAAHNSFVHCFAELGLVGYVVWLALLLITLMELRSLSKLDDRDETNRVLVSWSKAGLYSLVVYLAAAWFLSRTYVSTLYLVLGMAVAVINIAYTHERPPETPRPSMWIPSSAGLALGSIVLFWIVSRLYY